MTLRPSVARSDGVPSAVRILCANLRRGRVNADAFRSLLRSHHPDVVCVQELTPGLAAVIRETHRHGALHPHDSALGIGVASRVPVRTDRLALPHRPAVIAELDTGDGDPMAIMSVHLTHPLAFPPRRSQGRRRIQMEAIVGYTGGRGRVVVCGDLNTLEMWPLYRRLTATVDDGGRVLAARHGLRPEPTWSLRPDGRPILRLDHVLVRGVDVTALTVARLPGSDHRALVADLAIA